MGIVRRGKDPSKGDSRTCSEKDAVHCAASRALDPDPSEDAEESSCRVDTSRDGINPDGHESRRHTSKGGESSLDQAPSTDLSHWSVEKIREVSKVKRTITTQTVQDKA